MKLRILFTLLLGAGLWLSAAVAGDAKKGDAGWKQLFNGADLAAWDTWLGRPDGAAQSLNLVREFVKVSSLPNEKQSKILADLDELAKNLKEPVGLNHDPFQVYTVVKADGQPAIRISGQVFGAITSRDEFENYHLKLEFKWGTKKWPPRLNEVRDSGLLYHCVGPHGAAGSFWMRSQELQIQEKDCGDYWSVGGIVDVEGEKKGGAIVYKKGGEKFAVKGGRIVKSPDNEKPSGEWNTIELLCHGGTCVHLVNGKVNMVLTNSRQVVDGKEVPLTRGKLQLQSEGAEVYYRNIAIKKIDHIPDEYLK